MSEDRKLTLSDKPQAGAKGPDSGRGRPGFGARRAKPVVVERKRRRVMRRGEGPSGPAVVEENISLKPKKPARSPDEREEDPKLTSRERDARAAALKDAIREAEEARMRAAEEKRKRQEEAEKKAAEAFGGEKEEISAEDADEEARRRAELEAKQKAEEEARRAAEEELRRETGEVVERKSAPPRKEPPAKEVFKEKDEDAKPARKREAEKPRHAKLRKPEAERRRSGKLTITKALEGGEDYRPRSLAALKRAKAKQKRHGDEGDTQPKKAREVVVPEAITVQELANRMAEKAAAVVKTLMNMGVMATINDTLDQDTAELVVSEFGHTVKRVAESDVEIGLVGEKDDPKKMKPRAPVVTVMGHVDHGKTSLLDALRQTDVVSGEAGGITQHIGAYQIQAKDGKAITFIDTPGHEAFTEMRARGANVTDIVVLVVAADDGVKPQTVEAINHAKAAKVPMIVAINKMDVTGADPDKVRKDLLQHEVVVEKMSGEVLDVEVSAKKKTGLDKLQEAILLQAEVLELKANPARAAEGIVIEAKLDKGRGPVATMLVQRGTLKPGDILVAGAEWGKVRALVDDRGKRVKEAGPAIPVEALGLNGVPSAGDLFSVVEDETRAREVSEYRKEQEKKKRAAAGAVSLETMFSAMKEKKAEAFPLIIKADVHGSLEAVTSALEKVGNENIEAEVIHGAVGGVSETDVSLAKASDALIIGFNVRANKQAREAAEREGVQIRYYSVIYELVEDVKKLMEGELAPLIEENVIGTVEVKDVFPAGKKGRAAGCLVTDGVARAGAKVRLLRDDTVVYTGKIDTLRRFKDDVKEVKAGTECGILLENFSDVKKGDQLEIFETSEKKQTL